MNISEYIQKELLQFLAQVLEYIKTNNLSEQEIELIFQTLANNI